jgi:hypothetical protein
MPLQQAVNLVRALMLSGRLDEALAAAAWIVVVTGVVLPLPWNLLHHRLVR